MSKLIDLLNYLEPGKLGSVEYSADQARHLLAIARAAVAYKALRDPKWIPDEAALFDAIDRAESFAESAAR